MTSIVKSKSEKTEGKCKVYLVHVQVNDVQGKIQEVFDVIRNLSWVERLGNARAKRSYSVNAQETIEKLTKDIFNGGKSPLTEKTGEYVISVSSSVLLSKEYGHTQIPISELWKEEVTGNPGFDFHSVTAESIIIFGEAKYKSDPPSPYGTAFKQIKNLIDKKKDDRDLVHLQNFVDVFAIERFENGFKGYCAAFSLNAEDCDTVMSNTLTSTLAKPLFAYSELYIIGVEFVS